MRLDLEVSGHIVPKHAVAYKAQAEQLGKVTHEKCLSVCDQKLSF